MKDMATIRAEIRSSANSRANNRLRRAGYLPGSIFGKKIEPVSIAVSKFEFERLIKSHGRNAIFKVAVVGDQEYTVIAKDIQHDPLTNEILNVGFQKISLSEKIKADVAIKLVGIEAIEARRLVAFPQIDAITVRGLPQDIPDAIELDVSKLEAGETITVAELALPQGLEAENDPDQLVVSVSEPRKHEAEEEAEGEAETEAGTEE